MSGVDSPRGELFHTPPCHASGRTKGKGSMPCLLMNKIACGRSSNSCQACKDSLQRGGGRFLPCVEVVYSQRCVVGHFPSQAIPPHHTRVVPQAGVQVAPFHELRHEEHLTRLQICAVELDYVLVVQLPEHPHLHAEWTALATAKA